jgi:hypothetical protein
LDLCRRAGSADAKEQAQEDFMEPSGDHKAHRCRMRAEELRTMAAGMKHPDAVRDFTRAAAQWDRMADRADPANEGEEAPVRRRRRRAPYAARRAKVIALD